MTILNRGTVDIGRTLEAVLQRCMGQWGNGRLLVKTQPLPDGSDGPDAVLPAGSFAIPIVNGASLDEGTVYVKKNQATIVSPGKGFSDSGGDWTITAAGVVVDVETLQGGEQVNQVAGTLYRWDEPVPGIEEQSVLSTDVTGGDFSSDRIRQVRQLRQLEKADQLELYQGKVSAYPAVVIAWAGSAPSDGPMQTSPGPRTARTASQTMLYRTTWMLFVITSALESNNDRRRQGQRLVDDLLEVLADCQTARELRVSTAPGIEVLDSNPFATNARVYVDLIRFATHTALRRRPQDEVFSPWLTTRFVNELGDQARLPALQMPDESMGMPPNGEEPDDGELSD